jgi:transposase
MPLPEQQIYAKFCYKMGDVATKLTTVNPLNPELNPICYLLALLGAHHFLHVSRIRVNSVVIVHLFRSR